MKRTPGNDGFIHGGLVVALPRSTKVKIMIMDLSVLGVDAKKRTDTQHFFLLCKFLNAEGNNPFLINQQSN
jgi:hypothetical protein